MTLRPSARPTTPCFFGVAGFGVPADRGTELQSWLSPSELASPSLYASEPQQASSPRPLTSLHTHGTKAACLVHAPPTKTSAPVRSPVAAVCVFPRPGGFAKQTVLRRGRRASQLCQGRICSIPEWSCSFPSACETFMVGVH